ncbi:AAA family ATPase [Paucibacter sp. PLA-PC-4]|uniref:AAA family ATPase n=1 Tax=Paucibacter sp. PLA-PC-4 TaxID=2993655 RepID=UPI00224ABB9B|nr:AAA family ATPase [Paucibacter sp. PLA-PC-4]MCX2864305.1 AAA family ATPase [Paucibacter sp. PLA-PC-4]
MFDDIDTDELDRRVAERRQKTYSIEAIRRGTEIDKAIVIHGAFQSALASADRVFQLGKALTIPAGLRLIGPPGSGKTTLLRYYADSVPGSELFDRGCGAIRIRLRHRPTLRHTVESILRALRYPFPKVSNQSVGLKRDMSIDALKQKRTHLLLVDEAHNLCIRTSAWPAGSEEGNEITEYLREIMDAQIGLVLTGGPGLEQLPERDKYLHSRCASKAMLGNFALDNDWAGVVHGLAAHSQQHCLKFLTESRQIVLLHRATRGNLRALKMIVVEAILVAADAHRSDLCTDDLRSAFPVALGGLIETPNPWGV